MRSLALALAAVALAGCQQQDVAQQAKDNSAGPAVYQPDFGSNDIFREATAAAPGHELIVADLRLPPDAVGEPHFHPWEEYLYVIGGSAVLDIHNMESRDLAAGESFIIPRNTYHTPRAGPEGIRAIIVRVHDEGDPVSVPAAEIVRE